MRKSFICILFSFAFVFLFPSATSADIIPPNSRLLNRCFKVVNLNDFPDIVLISYVTGPMVRGSGISQIKNNECLSKGYKFNLLKIYWNTKDKPDLIDQNNLLLDNAEVYGGYIDQNNPLVKEDIEYSIAGFSGGKLVFYKSKQISEYNNGMPTKVESFVNPLNDTQTNNQDQKQKEIAHILSPIVPTPLPEPTKRGFWQSLICFFRGIFGKGCQ